MALFSASEIIKLGILIEQNGREFYAAAAQKTGSEKARALFAYLGDQETEHEKVFGEMLKAVGDDRPPEDTPEEYFAYIEALSKEHVFTERRGKDIAAQAKSDAAVLGLALGFEKDSILLFQEMKGFVSPAEYKIIDGLIAAERGHIITLTRLKKELAKK